MSLTEARSNLQLNFIPPYVSQYINKPLPPLPIEPLRIELSHRDQVVRELKARVSQLEEENEFLSRQLSAQLALTDGIHGDIESLLMTSQRSTECFQKCLNCLRQHAIKTRKEFEVYTI